MTLSDTDTAQLWETFRAGGGAELVCDVIASMMRWGDACGDTAAKHRSIGIVEALVDLVEVPDVHASQMDDHPPVKWRCGHQGRAQ